MLRGRKDILGREQQNQGSGMDPRQGVREWGHGIEMAEWAGYGPRLLPADWRECTFYGGCLGRHGSLLE